MGRVRWHSSGTRRDVTVEGLVKDDAMPAIYGEVLERLAKFAAASKTCPGCGRPRKDTYQFTQQGVTFVTCPWCHTTWAKAEYDALIKEM